MPKDKIQGKAICVVNARYFCDPSIYSPKLSCPIADAQSAITRKKMQFNFQ